MTTPLIAGSGAAEACHHLVPDYKLIPTKAAAASKAAGACASRENGMQAVRQLLEA
jgi:hypothetical protein